MMQTYQEIFSERGVQFAQACQLFDHAMQQEIEQFLQFSQIQPSDLVLDIAAAGGFFAQRLHRRHIQVIALDPCEALCHMAKDKSLASVCAGLQRLPFKDACIDKALCLVSLHHQHDLDGFFCEIYRVLKPHGSLVIAEVEEDSSPAMFLNQFVDQFSSLGHQGNFFSPEYVVKLKQAGFDIKRNEYHDYHWCFDHQEQMAQALQMMFGIDQASLAEIIHHTHEILKVDTLSSSHIGMRWGLRFINCQKQS